MLSFAGISVCRETGVRVYVFGIRPHADGLQPVFTPRVQAWLDASG